MPQKLKGRPSSAEQFVNWTRTCPDAIRILKLVHLGTIDTRGNVHKGVATYIKEYPGQIAFKDTDKGRPVKNFKRNIKSLLASYTKWQISGKGKKQQSKGTNCLFFES